MKTSNTQARQIHLSNTAMDSAGNAEISRGWIFAGFFLGAVVFLAGGFLDGAFFGAFAGLVDLLDDRAGFAAARFIALGFLCVGMPKYPDSGLAEIGPVRRVQEFERPLA